MSLITPDIRHQIHALTDWWEDAGVPVDQREIERLLREAEAQSANAATVTPLKPAVKDHAAEARALAKSADSLEALRDAINRFDGCELKHGAKQTVFADGKPEGGVMVIGEGPGRDEDIAGKPFVGRAGQLLDKMLASIGLSRETNTYITNVNFWRPPGNRNPTEYELALCRPFVDRHIALVKPKLIIAAGTVPAKSLLSSNDGIMKMRGQRYTLDVPDLKEPVPFFPIFHPAYLLRRPGEKARAWADLLNIVTHLEKAGIAPGKRP